MDNVIRASVSLFHDAERNSDPLEFNTLVINKTPFHADLLIHTRLWIVDRWVEFPEGHYYGGRPWTLQAIESFHGSIGLETILRDVYKAPVGGPLKPTLMADTWLEFGIWITRQDGIDKHYVYFRFDGQRWQREPGKPDFATQQ